uniref:Uncharacterized protein n=1 Tax=Oryza glaberrima TaxID=4538 RepID=I1QRR7_ORYGL
MESDDAVESAIEYARVSSDAMDSGVCVHTAYQCVLWEEDGEGHCGINLNKDLPNGHREGRAQGQHHGHRAPGAAHLGRAAVRAHPPPVACLLKLITAMKLKLCCCLFSAIKCTLKMN